MGHFLWLFPQDTIWSWHKVLWLGSQFVWYLSKIKTSPFVSDGKRIAWWMWQNFQKKIICKLIFFFFYIFNFILSIMIKYIRLEAACVLDELKCYNCRLCYHCGVKTAVVQLHFKHYIVGISISMISLP